MLPMAGRFAGRWLGQRAGAGAGRVRLASSALPRLFDSEGKIVQADRTLDYFAIFGLERSFSLDTAELSLKFKALQRLLHPDRFAVAEPGQLAASEEWSALVNNSYQVLQRPLPRALYLLQLAGVPLQEEGGLDIEPEFLGEIMELNEEVVEAGEAELQLLTQTIKSKINEYVETIDILFLNEEFEKARIEVAQMKYYSNVLEKIYEKLGEFGVY